MLLQEDEKSSHFFFFSFLSHQIKTADMMHDVMWCVYHHLILVDYQQQGIIRINYRRMMRRGKREKWSSSSTTSLPLFERNSGETDASRIIFPFFSSLRREKEKYELETTGGGGDANDHHDDDDDHHPEAHPTLVVIASFSFGPLQARVDQKNHQKEEIDIHKRRRMNKRRNIIFWSHHDEQLIAAATGASESNNCWHRNYYCQGEKRGNKSSEGVQF